MATSNSILTITNSVLFCSVLFCSFRLGLGRPPLSPGSPVFPVILDSQRTVASFPPIINSAHSAISLATKDIFIECTATDLTKAKIVLNTVVAMFSEYCREPFTVEPIDVVYPDGNTMRLPDIGYKEMRTTMDYINKGIGIEISPEEVCSLLSRMQVGQATRRAGVGGESIRYRHRSIYLSIHTYTSIHLSLSVTRSSPRALIPPLAS